MSRWRARLALIVSGAGVLALVAGVVVLDRMSPVGPAAAANPRQVAVAAAATSMACAGPVRLPASTDDPSFNPTPVGAVTAVRGVTSPVDGDGESLGAAATGTITDLVSGSELAHLDPTGQLAGVAASTAASGSSMLTATPSTGRLPRAAGTSSSLVSSGDLRGLATAACVQAGAEQWLVGGSTALSSNALLSLANPGSTSASVDLTIWGPNGLAKPSGGSALLVAPHSQRQLLLSGIAAEQRRIVVRVSASGGTVAASLQDDQLDGLTPGGLSFVSPATPPATRQVVSGIVVPTSTTDATNQAVVRILAPGTAGTTAALTLVGPDGLEPLPGASTIDLPAGTVVDVPLAGIPAGSYAAVVDASEPIVAGAMITRVGQPGPLEDQPVVDRAWAASQIAGLGGVIAIPDVKGATFSVVLSAVGTAAVDSGSPARGTLRWLGADGGFLGKKDVSLTAGTTLTVPVDSLGGAAAAVDLTVAGADAGETSGATLVWALVTTVTQHDGDLVAVVTPVAPSEIGAAVPVSAGTRIGLP